jgi:hypothetical protein
LTGYGCNSPFRPLAIHHTLHLVEALKVDLAAAALDVAAPHHLDHHAARDRRRNIGKSCSRSTAAEAQQEPQVHGRVEA